MATKAMMKRAKTSEQVVENSCLSEDEYSEFLLLRGAFQYSQEALALIRARLSTWLENHDLPTRFEVDKFTREVRVLPPPTPVAVPSAKRPTAKRTMRQAAKGRKR